MTGHELTSESESRLKDDQGSYHLVLVNCMGQVWASQDHSDNSSSDLDDAPVDAGSPSPVISTGSTPVCSYGP
jgi:hypothetical protein